ncbi:putative carboxypeptidase PM20D1 [Brachionus plicatilis]|uniref:Putative carboxypeptidase PM20D1 n=1 Tax=Brachionus plicatilis TaxID=10195 RepID=A0A3M7PC45_BRAPC|nr:putative carboxypeptidase PM20D1 [Brachionus plicatilis]
MKIITKIINSNNKTMKKIFACLSILFSLFFLFLVYRAYVVNQPCKHQIKIVESASKFQINNEILNRFKNSLKIQTVSYGQNNQNFSALKDFISFIQTEFSDIEAYKYAKLDIINNYSLLYKIQGSDLALKPYLLAAHFDVVPADGQNDNWKFDPFSATTDEGFIYGRGTLDDKSSMLGQLEALRIFLKKNGQPRRTIYLAYGHDEEASGYQGAKSIAKFLGNTTLEFVLDEGTMIVEKVFKGLDTPLAYIGSTEKGYLTVKFFVNTTGGHSSMPNPEESAIFIVADAISKMKKNKHPSFLGYGPETTLLTRIATNLGFIKRVLLSNIWIFRPAIEFILSMNPTTDSLLRTTTAVTIVRSGVKENVLPSYAEFYVNHRIHSLQSCKEVLDYDLAVINDKRINYEIIDCSEPIKTSSIESLGYSIIEHTTYQIFPGVSAVPSIMIALTDSRFYTNLTENIYRYLPIRLLNEDLKRYHGVDERITTQGYEDMINFYYLIFKNTDDAHLDKTRELRNEL